MQAVSQQLEILGLDGARRLAESTGASPRERSRLLRRVDVTHELMSSMPAAEDLSFLHSGLCQTCLPHSKPMDTIWRRQSGRRGISQKGHQIDFAISKVMAFVSLPGQTFGWHPGVFGTC
jgi:hypothetical protein